MINQNLKIIFQISQPTNIPKKWFCTLNVPLDVGFQMRLTKNVWAFVFLKSLTKTMEISKIQPLRASIL